MLCEQLLIWSVLDTQRSLEDGSSRRPGLQGIRHVFFLTAVNFATLGSLTAPVIIGLPRRIADLVPADEHTAALAVILAVGALSAVVANPLFGYLSDRTRGPFGRRHPWIVFGALGGAVASVVLVQAQSLYILTAAWVAMQLLYNATFAAVTALLADTVPDQQRPAAAGVFSAAAYLGTIPVLALAAFFPDHLGIITLVMPAVAIFAAVATVIWVREPAAFVGTAFAGTAARASANPPRAFSLRDAPGFAQVWLQRLFAQTSMALLLAFTLYFVVDRMNTTEVDATPITSANTALGGAAVVIAATVAGFWAARRSNYFPFLAFAIGGLAGAAILRAFATDSVLLWVSAAIGGLAIGTFTAVDLALALRTIPRAKAGTYLGVLNITETVPQIVVPLAAVPLLTIGGADPFSGGADNYFALYLSAAVMALIAACFLPAVRRIAARTAAQQDAISQRPTSQRG